MVQNDERAETGACPTDKALESEIDSEIKQPINCNCKLKNGWLTATINYQEFILDTEADITGKSKINEQEIIGTINIQYTNGKLENAPLYRDQTGINYIKSATNLLSLFDVLIS